MMMADSEKAENYDKNVVKDADKSALDRKEAEVTTKSQRRNRRRRRRRKENAKEMEAKREEKSATKLSNPTAGSEIQSKNKNKKRRRRRRGRRTDIYYGRFRCKLCNRHWDSARVFTVGGTKIVMYRQRCKLCTGDGAWVFPFRLELIRCSQCQKRPCECLCEECNKLKHKRFTTVTSKVVDDDGSERVETQRIVDPDLEFCDCERPRKDKKLGDKIDPKKRHMSELCEKCLKGHPCIRAQQDDDYEDNENGDNEP